MLRLAERNVELGVVADQFGAPTSARAIAETVAGIIDRFAVSLNQIDSGALITITARLMFRGQNLPQKFSNKQHSGS